jgi:hypothetical protein
MLDPIDLLTPSSAGPDAQHRRRVLDATLGELRRRRRGRRERRVAALAAALAAALLLFAVLPPPQTQRFRLVEDDVAKKTAAAIDVEWDALERPAEAKQLYRQAGERYVAEGDFAGAVRNYGGSLDAGTTEDLEPTPDDDWLLAAIKIARKKETER